MFGMSREEKKIIGAGVATLAIIAGAFGYDMHESNKWETFSTEHHCEVVSKAAGSIRFMPVVGSKGNIDMILWPESEKVSYRCDDGITYTR